MLKQAVPQSTRKPVTRTALKVQLTVKLHPDKTDDFTEELEALARKYAGENYTFDWQEN